MKHIGLDLCIKNITDRILQLRRVLEYLHLLALIIGFCTLRQEWEADHKSDGGVFKVPDLHRTTKTSLRQWTIAI